MKRLTYALTAIGILGATANLAHAQSAVTLYGIIDTALVYSNNQKGESNYQMSSGTLSGSRWGMKGQEDLGGGLQALYVLENGFSSTTGTLGQNGREFGRAAYVGLQSPYGRVTAGRQNEASADFIGTIVSSNLWGGGLAAHPGDTDNYYVNARISNSVKYLSNDYAGFRVSGLYSFGGTAGNFSNNRIWSLGAQYARGPLVVAASYLNASQPNTSLYDGTAGTASISPNNSPIFSGYTSARTQQVAGVGAAYTFGAATVDLVYSNVSFQDIGSPSGAAPVARFRGDTAIFDNVEAGVKYQLTPSVLLGASYNYTRTRGAGDAHYNQANVGADYFLSKRTDVYLSAGYQQASGTDSTGKQAVAALWPISASSNNHQIVAALGLRHRF
jgi:predicted porin